MTAAERQRRYRERCNAGRLFVFVEIDSEILIELGESGWLAQQDQDEENRAKYRAAVAKAAEAALHQWARWLRDGCVTRNDTRKSNVLSDADE